jgi:hypothetical protein
MHHPSFWNVVLAGIIFLGACGFLAILVAIFTARPDPNDEEKNRGRVIHFVDERGNLHYEDEPKMKVK